MARSKSGNRIVVADASWAETIPRWILQRIEAERMAEGFKGLLDKDDELAGDAEVVAYLYTANLAAPMRPPYSDIYIYLCAKLLQQRNAPLEDWMQAALDQGLDYDAERELANLRHWIYRKRGPIQTELFAALEDFKKEVEQMADRSDHSLAEFGGVSRE